MNNRPKASFSSEYVIWAMWALASLFYAFQYILRVLPNIMMDQIIGRFDIDAALFGQFSGVYYIGYAALHIPVGIMLDRYGPRIVMSTSIILAVLGLLPLIFCEDWVWPVLGRALFGAASSAAILGVFKVIRMAFPEERFTRMLGFSVAIGLVGAIYGGQPVLLLMKYFGWDKVIEILCLMGILLALAVYGIMPAYDSPARRDRSITAEIKSVFSNSRVMLVCLFAGLMVGPIEGFADAWGTGFLRAFYGFTENTSAYLPSLIFLGMCFGSPALSYSAERTGAYYPITILAAVLMASIFVYILLGFANQLTLTLLFLLMGMLCAYQILVIYKASTYVKASQIGLTTAIANMIIMTFGYFFHSSIGYVMSKTWDGQMADGRPVYSGDSFIMGLSIIPVTLLLAAAGYYWIWKSEQR